ncbi:hypothetical protein [Streptomyces sp. NPDC006784]|uniref:hypothetical protein n=1 Tax=Streptomyces sp. NPDC006784 TaxID=3364764 RepID=UPI0036C3984E
MSSPRSRRRRRPGLVRWMINWSGCWLTGPGPEGCSRLGEGGLLPQLTERLLESALDGEMTDHLGYE